MTLRWFLQNWRKNILDKYKVKINPKAIRELDQIYEYIANEKLAPENVKGQIERIKKIVLIGMPANAPQRLPAFFCY